MLLLSYIMNPFGHAYSVYNIVDNINVIKTTKNDKWCQEPEFRKES
jgi:hypothetical protein